MDEFVVSNDLLREPKALRARAQQEGYLFFRGLLAPELLRRLREQITDLCAEAGWLEPGSDPTDGIAASGIRHIEGETAFMEVYGRVQKMQAFHELAHAPALIGALDTLFGEPTLAHPRNIARIIFPAAAEYTTPAHQDYIHIGGTEETWTSWIPLGDCPKELGSLAILPRSHQSGLFPVHRALGAGGVGIDTDDLPYRWAASDFAAGDVILFHSLLVHKGLPNLTRDRLRLSVDFRFQGVSQPIAKASLNPHMGSCAWEEIYAGWTSPSHKYYWKELDLQLAD